MEVAEEPRETMPTLTTAGLDPFLEAFHQISVPVGRGVGQLVLMMVRP